MKKKYLPILILLILLFFIINYNFLDSWVKDILKEREMVVVERVIDGDTIEANSESIRLLGINSPEKGEEYYEEAREYLGGLILNKSVYLEYGKERKDKYGRTLAYVFYNGDNINLKIVEKGYANYYFPSGKDVYYLRFKEAWEECIRKNENLCEKSKDACSKCVDIKYSQGKITLIDFCSFSCSFEEWTIKGEGRDIFEIVDNEAEVGEQDTLFLRDGNNNLVLWKSY